MGRAPQDYQLWKTKKAAATRHTCLLYTSHGGHAADGGHVAFVEVAEFGTRLGFEIGGDDAGGVGSHLHSRLRDAGHLVAVLLEVGEVAGDEDIGQAWGIEVVVDQDTAAFVELNRNGRRCRGAGFRGPGIGWRGQELAQWRGLDAGCPQSDNCIDAGSGVVVLCLDPAGAKVFDLRIGCLLYTSRCV